MRPEPTEAAAAPASERGETLRGGRYEIRAVLGSGAHGETLKAVDSTDGRAVAIKRFFVLGARGWKDFELAEREARVLQTLSHPCLPAYIDHFEEGGVLHLVMELVEGETLSSLRASGKVTRDEVLAFLEDVAGTLQYLHSRRPPLIHRDVKPTNVIRRPNGNFALVDFGSVRDGIRPQGGSTVAGTFGYMAPEQFQGRAAPESDVYAVGATVLATLTGVEPENLPHRGLALDVHKALAGSPDADLERALTSMLEPDPDRRPKSVSSVLERFELKLGVPRKRVGHRAILFVLAAALATLAFVIRGHLASNRALSRAGGQEVNECRSDITRLIAGGDPWKARARARDCGDFRELAEAEWSLGNLWDAGRLYVDARSDDSPEPVTVSEVEAVLLFDRTRVPKLLRRLEGEWYKGPRGEAQTQLEALIRYLDTKDGPRGFKTWKLGSGYSNWLHHQPAFALHEPAVYLWERPAFFDEGSECTSEFEEQKALVAANCRGNVGVVRALFGAITGDSELLATELASIDGLLDELKKVNAIPRTRRREFNEQLDGARFDAQRLLAVAAAAAWYGPQDLSRMTSYLPFAEAHARAILEEHLELVAGTKIAPDPGHSPGDYSAPDMDLFAAAGQISPDALIAKMRALHYTSPARLAALVASRKAEREALAVWVKGGFPAACTDCGLFPLLDATFRRREAARLVGDTELEARLLDISQKLGRALIDENFAVPVVAFESLLGR